MIGIKIALTGLVFFIFSMLMFGAARKPPENKRIGGFMALLGILSLAAMPIGLIIAIWE